jgi:hypothetical protein
MPAGCVGSAVIVRQEVDELAIHFRASPEFDFCGVPEIGWGDFSILGTGKPEVSAKAWKD